MKLSSGVPNDIDLTERGNFRNGAPNLLHQKEYKHGVLPWNSEGILKVKPASRSTIYYRSGNRLNEWNTISVWHDNIDVSMDDELFYADEIEIVENDYDLYKAIPIGMSGKYEITEDPRSLIPYITNSKVQILGDSVIASALFSAKFKNDDTDIDYIDDNDGIYDYVSFTPSSTSTNNWSRNIQSQVISSFSSSTVLKNYQHLKFNITPVEFTEVSLSLAEISGKKLVCGKGDELKLKLRKLEYLKEVQKLLDEYYASEKYPVKICPDCKRKYISNILGYDKWSSECPDCRIKHGIFDLNYNASKLHFDRRDFHDYHKEIMKGDGFLSFDNEDNQFNKSFDTIDFYRHCRYDDRGRFLVQLPRRSHELEVNLQTGLLEEDEPDENRRSSRATLYFTPGGNRANFSIFTRGQMLRLLNRA